MNIGGRSITTILGAISKKRHYITAINMLRIYNNPLDAYARYVLKKGGYPTDITVTTPIGDIKLKLFSHHDILTLNEIFCRHDYRSEAGDTIIVDFGSNIGISAAYFLTRSPISYVYLHEPLPRNIARLKENLVKFEGRFELSETAIGPKNGQVEFGWEETGRYGGIGLQTGNCIQVECRDSNQVLEEIISRHGKINILKIDIETLEREVTERIPSGILQNIDKIYVEQNFRHNPLEPTHSYRQYGDVAQFRNKMFSKATSLG